MQLPGEPILPTMYGALLMHSPASAHCGQSGSESVQPGGAGGGGGT